jgi:membrane-associated phospholipid phosphatase
VEIKRVPEVGGARQFRPTSHVHKRGFFRRAVDGDVVRAAAREFVLLSVCLLVLTGLGIGIGALITGPFVGPVSRHLDRPANLFAVSHPSAFWDGVLKRIEPLGTVWGAAALVVAIGGVFAFAVRSWQPLYQCVVALAGAALITVAVREVVTRPAQDGPVKGFPSGHVLLAVAVCGTAGVLAMRSIERSWLRWTVAVTLAVLAVAVACARVYRLDHVATDVLGSVILGIAWVYAVARFASRRETRYAAPSYFSASSRL